MSKKELKRRKEQSRKDKAKGKDRKNRDSEGAFPSSSWELELTDRRGADEEEGELPGRCGKDRS